MKDFDFTSCNWLTLTIVYTILIFPWTSAEIQVVSGPTGLVPQVDTLNGRIQGKLLRSKNNRTYAAFEGIEYGNFVGRFKAPAPPLNWTGLKVTDTPGAICPQFEVASAAYQDTEERCLFANVYVPLNGNDSNSKPMANLTTMVWFHGGGFINGAGSFYGAHYFTDEDVLLVTVNYRLGNFGFLHTGDGDGASTGNFGFKDLIMALKWVQENKGRLANETGSTTIFGESAGAAAVHGLVLSPAAKGLFDKGVMQSGTLLSPWATQQTPLETSKAFAKELNCTITNTTQMVDCLRTKTIRQLLEAETKVSARGNFSVYSFGPTVDGKTKVDAVSYDYPVLPSSPLDLIENGGNSSSLEIPLIIGTNEKEGLMTGLSLILNPFLTAEVNKNWETIMPEVLLLNSQSDRNKSSEEIVRQVREFYFGNKSISISTSTNLINLYSDRYWYTSIRQTAQLHAKTGAQVYPYILTFPGKFSFINYLGLPTQGVTHADDVQYFFDNTQGPPPYWPNLSQAKDVTFSANIIKSWTSFGRTGVPELWGSSKWSALTPSQNSGVPSPMTWLDLKETPADLNETTSVMERVEFWQTVFYTHDSDDQTTTSKEDQENLSSTTESSANMLNFSIQLVLVIFFTQIL